MLLMAMGVILFISVQQRRIIRHQLEIKSINDIRQQELVQAMIRGEEEERKRIASELHDDIGATLSSVRLFMAKAVASSDAALVRQSKELIDESIQKIRAISHRIQPTLLYRLGLVPSLQSLAETINASGTIKMNCVVGQTVSRFEQDRELSIYRIVQELLNNTIKYASPDTIVLDISAGEGDIIVAFRHNGDGLVQETFLEKINKSGAIGLKNIVSRLQIAHASINFSRENDGWYQATITTPDKLTGDKNIKYGFDQIYYSR